MSEFQTIESAELNQVVGGAEGDGYTWGDAVRGGAGALLGGLTGGPVGAVVGFGAGFMSRNVGNLGNAHRHSRYGAIPAGCRWLIAHGRRDTASP